ncbi:MAG: methyltransferase domain-containing protein [Chloroflexota bacterium]|nr:MAG: methyltransferase domain-containing protein [Chloroflexota bacterium]
MADKIEILPVSLLETEGERMLELKKLARSLKLEFGWHYLLDITWILQQLDRIEGLNVIDAGAGTGMIQWYLAESGARVISVDRESRADLQPKFRDRFEVSGLRDEDLDDRNPSSWRNRGINRRSFKSLVSNIIYQLNLSLSRRSQKDNVPGQVIIYNQDLGNLVDIPDNSVEAVVAVSSLEHNSPERLVKVVAELLRVLKPGGPLLATLGAAKESDWYHQPSKGWCYTEKTLRKIFRISTEIPSNYDQYDHLFNELKECTELSDNLASFYFRSGDNGMPWGIWEPEYQPVGVCKIKNGA